ncbi:SusD/RagB family nutrient-binding outer membrane lipoprotein [Maribellus sp. CM-23]|uniref:SusD/RagB family nutrient-binding outer membrane lipoprotein n=1 Tax=Maribellus sp. CM-23 TaxID=2781026 RepID=UPI001F40B546|nr:SusD/RagB family nutrient-binding outer membrane lipoprotein [Maribellus sp. CM-23]MCE4565583.1 SusD/RagB family nutrient-binding outer membrane lipoprotein [Maribellus sp. CM-23]
MKSIKFLIGIIPFLIFSCSEDKMDEINKELNNALEMSAQNEIADIILKSAFETTGTDIAWYATVYTEQSAGTWGQSVDADKRIGQTAATLFNNNWNNLYDVMMICNDVIKKTDPETGDEADNLFARGIAQLFSAYNLAMLTDMWGEVPWTEALMGADNLQPKFDKQSAIYPDVLGLFDDAVTSFTNATNISSVGDYIYNGNKDKWIKAAYSLKARYLMHLVNVKESAASEALGVIANGFAGSSDAFLFDAYEATAIGENPWYQFLSDRTHLSVSQTLYNIMVARNDTLRMAAYFEKVGGVYNPAPSGTATQTQGGLYSQSLITANGRTAATPIMTYHELKFIEAEAKFRTGSATWSQSLQAAVEANFVFHGLTAAQGTIYFNASVSPLLTAGNELKEILTQKYIALYEHEAIEVYNDYRRVPSFLTLNNPNNQTTGFVWRFPYPTSEEASNSANVPEVNVFSDKVWWAGGTEK